MKRYEEQQYCFRVTRRGSQGPRPAPAALCRSPGPPRCPLCLAQRAAAAVEWARNGSRRRSKRRPGGLCTGKRAHSHRSSCRRHKTSRKPCASGTEAPEVRHKAFGAISSFKIWLIYANFSYFQLISSNFHLFHPEARGQTAESTEGHEDGVSSTSGTNATESSSSRPFSKRTAMYSGAP